MRSAWITLLISAAPALAGAMTVGSADLKDGAPMPSAQIYPRCGGQNVSPALAWSDAPLGARSFVLTMIDLSVKPSDWSHWIIADIPPGVTHVAHGAGGLPPPARGVASNMGSDRYAGPCPPPGTGVHRYEITVWAMPTPTVALRPDGPATALAAQLAHVSLAHASLTATAGQ